MTLSPSGDFKNHKIYCMKVSPGLYILWRQGLLRGGYGEKLAFCLPEWAGPVLLWKPFFPFCFPCFGHSRDGVMDGKE